MQKEIGSLILGFLLTTEVNAQTLQDKLKNHLAEGRIKQQPEVQYILRENRVSSFVKRYELDGKMFEEFYMIYPMQFRHPLGVSIPVGDKPYFYYFDSKWYEDNAQDGINGNEVEKKSGDL